MLDQGCVFLGTYIKIIFKNKLIDIGQVFHGMLNPRLKFLQFVTALLLVGLGVHVLQDGNLAVKEVQFLQILVVVLQAPLIDFGDLFISFGDLQVLFLDG